jgi:AraC-like DNA-binding protein
MNLTVYKDEKVNALRVSRITKIEQEMPFRGLGIKYVVSGEETYYSKKRKFTVSRGEYLIGNDFTESVVKINNTVPVEGICIDVSGQIVSEVADYYDSDNRGLKEFLLSEQLFVNRYNESRTCIGNQLRYINEQLRGGSIDQDFAQNEFFYSLAESLVRDQLFVFNHLQKLRFKKVLTNEEIFRAILSAKDLVDERYMDKLSLDDLALKAGISKYHFVRVFKSVFGKSPYGYQKSSRLRHAREELVRGRSANDVAGLFAYADLPTFSKAFKKEFGYSPTHLKKGNF